MRPKITYLTGLAALLIIVGSGYVHGVWSFRWTAADAVKDAVARLGQVPDRVGDWTGTDMSLEERQMKIGKIAGAVTRVYSNAKTGQRLSFLVVCGRPGPIAVHTPDVCYGGNGYASVGDRQRLSVDFGPNERAEFYAIRMQKPDPAKPSTLVIDFGWFAGGKWSVPQGDGRLSFASYPVLYKMYVVREQSSLGESNDFDPNVDFLKAMLPVLQPILGATPS